MRGGRAHDLPQCGIAHHLTGVNDKACRADTHLEAQCAEAADHAVLVCHRFPGIHDHDGASASQSQETAVGRLLDGLASRAGAKQRLFDSLGGDTAAAVEMGDPTVAVAPHPENAAHPVDCLAEPCPVGADKACRDAGLDKAAHQHNLAIRHPAGVTAIVKNKRFELRHQHIEKCLNPVRIAAHGGFGECDATKRADLVVDRFHPPPVDGQTTDLHFHRSRQPALECFIGGVAVPAEIHG